MPLVSKKGGIPAGLRNILVIRLGAMGDILRTLPPVRLLRMAAPSADIRWACDDRWTQVLEHHADLDGLIPLPRKEMQASRSSPAGWVRAAGLIRRYRRKLQAGKFDLVLDFHGNLRSGIIGWMTGAKVRLGYGGHQQKEGNRLFTTFKVEPGDRRTSRMDRNLSLLDPLGIDCTQVPDGGLPLDPELDREASRLVRAVLGECQGYAVVSPGVSAGQAYKKPPPELLAAAARRLRRSGIGVLVTHGPGELADAEQVATLAGGDAAVAPATTLPLLAHLIRNGSLFIGGDTGPLHMACAVGTPVLGLYGPTDPQVNAPWNVPHVTVYPRDRTYTGIKKIDRAGGGFTGLTAKMVLDGLERLLAGL